MFSLITNETILTMKSDHIKPRSCMHHHQNMFILSIIETNSRGSFDLSQTKHVSANVVSMLNIAPPLVPEELDK